MIERFYDKCKLRYCIKYFQWRKKYLSVYYGDSVSNDLHEQLSIEKRSEMMQKADRSVFSHTIVEPEDPDEQAIVDKTQIVREITMKLFDKSKADFK
mmetsp:Transcript_3986/g.4867  ORF Transcript_3986/g.4867 Transcript_3986/m.4867 type:complete len:97 (-) Transcript_3986:324-614(-)